MSNHTDDAPAPVRSVTDILAIHECADPLTGATNFESWSKGTVTF